LLVLATLCPPFEYLDDPPAGFLICKNLLPLPGDFGVWCCGGEVRIEASLEKGGAARAALARIRNPRHNSWKVYENQTTS